MSMTDKEMLALQRERIRRLEAQLAECRTIFIRYAHENGPMSWHMAAETVDRLLGLDDDPNRTTSAQTPPK